MTFSVIGGGLFLLGFGLQWLLVTRWHLGAVPSFVFQGLVCLQASFLLNHYWTWRDQHVRFWRAWSKFNMQKIVTTVANFAVYVGMVRLGINYLVANVLATAIFTVINYLAGHYWVFRTKAAAPQPVRTSPATAAR